MRSDAVKTGTQQAPHRSLFNALGMTKEEMDRPLVGIVSSYNEIVPGHMNLDKITQAVKLGVAMAGGTPVMFPAIAVCDGIAMGHVGMKYSLVTRDLIADSTEAMAMAHQFDALVMIPNCDIRFSRNYVAVLRNQRIVQRLHRRLGTRLLPGQGSHHRADGGAAVQAVSYTHLDVYKRQDWMISTTDSRPRLRFTSDT